MVARSAAVGKAEFISTFQKSVMQLAMLLHQYRNGAASAEQVLHTVHALGSRLCGCLLSQDWAPRLFAMNLDACVEVEVEPPEAHWDRVVKCMAVGPETVRAGDC